MRGLYAIVDVTTVERAGLDVLGVAEALLDARPACIQLRAKGVAPRTTLALLRELRPLTHRAGMPLFANDRPDLALLAECDGVHVGQLDLSVQDVVALDELARDHTTCRRRLLVGVSTHDTSQVRAALRTSIDYLAIGPVFQTGSKENPDPVLGIDTARQMVELSREARPELPVVAIGGLNRGRARELSAIVDMVAVIGALMPQEPMPRKDALDWVRARASEIVALFEQPIENGARL